MMERKTKFYSDIIQSINYIEEFTKEINSFDQYASNMKTKSAVERQLMIIGEAVIQLRKLDSTELISSQQIISFRNRLAHAYDSIDDSIVWNIIKRHLEPLKKEISEKSKQS